MVQYFARNSFKMENVVHQKLINKQSLKPLTHSQGGLFVTPLLFEFRISWGKNVK
jgi:hypothetical protein